LFSPTYSVCLPLSFFFEKISHPSSITPSRMLNTGTIGNGVVKFELFSIGIRFSSSIFDEPN
jgi:hypothetical protein